MTFPTKDGPWTLDPLTLEMWKAAYDADVEAELRRALSWLDANPQKRKTKRGMKKFLVAWLARANPSSRAGSYAPTTKEDVARAIDRWQARAAQRDKAREDFKR